MNKIAPSLTAALALALATSLASAQSGARPAPQKPAAKPAEAPAPKKEEPKSETPDDPLKKIFGEKGFNLKCENGISFEQDLSSGDMKFMRIKGNIDLKSELMNLKCEDIVIDNVKQEMTATATASKPVDFAKDEIAGVCGKLIYDIEHKKTTLLGPPRPYIRQKDKNGNVTQTSSDTITIIETEKTRNVLLEGRSEINSVTPEEKKPEKGANGEKEPAQKIESGAAVRVNPNRTPSRSQ